MDKLDKQIEQIKISRLNSMDKYIYDTVKSVKKRKYIFHPNRIFYNNKENGDLIFEYNKKTIEFRISINFYCNLSSKYNLSVDGVFIKVIWMANKYFKLKNIKPNLSIANWK